MGRNFLTQGNPGVRVRNVRGKSGPKSLCLCCLFFPELSGHQACRSVFVKLLVKLDLEFDLKFEISDGKNLMKFCSGQISEQISGKISETSFQISRPFSETSFSRRAVLIFLRSHAVSASILGVHSVSFFCSATRTPNSQTHSSHSLCSLFASSGEWFNNLYREQLPINGKVQRAYPQRA